jgi:hypothetical protein
MFFSAYFVRIVATKQGAKTHWILRLFFVPFFGRAKKGRSFGATPRLNFFGRRKERNR